MQGHASERRPLRVAYLGPPASFSHQAAREAFPTETTTVHPLPTFSSILSAIQDFSNEKPESEPYDFGLLPFENSTNGNVVQVLDLLIQCGLDPKSSRFPDIEVIAEHYLEVHHCLYISPSALDALPPDEATRTDSSTSSLIDRLHITALYTHPQVWGQCNKFLSSHFKPTQTERIDMSSTSAAAVFVAQNSPSHSSPPVLTTTTTIATDAPSKTTQQVHPGNIAAICSSLAGTQHNLYSLASNIEDKPGKNTTRFLIIRNRNRDSLLHSTPTSLSQASSHLSSQYYRHSRKTSPTSLTSPSSLTTTISNGAKTSNTDQISYKSLITFTIAHTLPGSLAAVLSTFSRHDFNLTAITTRPSRETNWHYVFFVECEEAIQVPALTGQQRLEDQGRSARLEGMLAELVKVTERMCCLGSWVDRLRYP